MEWTTEQELSEWAQFVNNLNRKPVRRLIVESEGSNLQPSLTPSNTVPSHIGEGELQERLESNREYVGVAVSHLDWLTQQYGHTAHALFLVDKDGIMLHSAGNLLDAIESLKLLPGYDWSKRPAQASSIGNSLISNIPVVAVGLKLPEGACDTLTYMEVPVEVSHSNPIGAIGLIVGAAPGNPERLIELVHTANVIGRELDYRTRIRNMESLKVFSRLSDFMAHELANPLTVIHGYLTLLSTNVLDEESTKLVTKCKQVMSQMRHIVKELRHLGNYTESGFRCAKLLDLINECPARLNLSDRYEFRVEIDDDLTISGHPDLIRLALLNLVRNAVEAMPQGGTIGFRAGSLKECIRLAVWDNGPGLPAAIRDQIFSQPVTTKTEGSGIGLMLVKGIIEYAHGGKVYFEPHEPQGAQFILELPRTPAAVG